MHAYKVIHTTYMYMHACITSDTYNINVHACMHTKLYNVDKSRILRRFYYIELGLLVGMTLDLENAVVTFGLIHILDSEDGIYY